MPEWALLLLPLLLLLGAIAGSAAGFGLFLFVGPLLWIFYTPSEAVAFSFSASWGITGFVLLRHWRSIDRGLVQKIILASGPGLILGVLLHGSLPRSALLLLGSAVIGLAILLRYWHGKLQPFLGGLLAGALTSSVGFNGPPVALSTHGKDPEVQRSTMIFVLFVLSLLALPLIILSGSADGQVWKSWLLGILALPLVFLGAWIGDRLAHRIGRGIEILALLLSLAGGGSLALAALGLF